MKKSNLTSGTFLLSLIIAITLLCGCAEMSGWHPTVDTYNDPNTYRIGQDMAECKLLAKDASGTITESLTNGGVGALIGAAGGAIAGAFLGSPGLGAGIGAATGGFGGSTYGGVSGNDKFKTAYKTCMRNRQHNVLG